MRLQMLIPPPLYAGLCGVAMFILNEYLPFVIFDNDIAHFMGMALIVIAILFDLWSIGLLMLHKTTVNPLTPRRTAQCVTTGLYRYTRNPMYVGLLLMLCGFALRLGSVSPFLLLPVFVWVITWSQIIPEEHMLEEKFGQAYRTYKRRVRRWL